MTEDFLGSAYPNICQLSHLNPHLPARGCGYVELRFELGANRVQYIITMIGSNYNLSYPFFAIWSQDCLVRLAVLIYNFTRSAASLILAWMMSIHRLAWLA
jgi:hypothetical protein